MIIFDQNLIGKKSIIYTYPKGVRKGQQARQKIGSREADSKNDSQAFPGYFVKKTPLTKVETSLATTHKSTIMINAVVPNI